ncbi:MAG: hypothetical protein M1837_006985 [Sclerophora amabilis]|nr:MAG: hypothetical protein M1837_006985 [Sclerophora amabilis]
MRPFQHKITPNRMLDHIRSNLEGQDQSLEELFNSFTQQKGDTNPGPSRFAPWTTAQNPGNDNHQLKTTKVPNLIRELEKKLSDFPSTPISACWAQLSEVLNSGRSSQLKQGLAQNTALLPKDDVFRSILSKTIDIWSSSRSPANLPGPSAAVVQLQDANLMRDAYWAEILHPLLVAFIQAKDVDEESPEQQMTAEAQKAWLMHGILKVWKLFFQSFSSASKPTGRRSPDSNDWAGLPDEKELERIRVNFSKSFQIRFLHFFPKLGASREGLNLSTAALVTYHLLCTQQAITKDINTTNPTAFQSFIAHLLPYSHTGTVSMKQRLDHWRYPKDFTASMLAEFENPTSKTLISLASGEYGVETGQFHSESKSMESHFLKRLNRAMEKADLERINALWNDAQSWYATERPSGGKEEGTSSHSSATLPRGDEIAEHTKQKLPESLFNRFIMIFMSLRCPDKAIDVWNRLAQAGAGPSQATWHAMLSGCRAARDVHASNDVWQKMISAGVKPDIRCWTTRIHTLSSCGRHELALQTLNQMGRDWLQVIPQASRGQMNKDRKAAFATFGDVNGVVKPTIEAVNAAMSGLLYHKRVEDVRRVMVWADTFGIKSDVVTFNMLMKNKIREGDPAGALQLVQAMESLQVTPDIVTFTIMLDGFFRDFIATNTTDEDKQRAAAQTLEEMESLGICANVFSYGTLIDALLKHHSNLAAAEAVLNHMVSKNIKPSPHIHTMLLHHHFVQPTPDLAIIETLWHRIQLDGGVVDVILYDRMVEGYARVGETNKMMSFLKRMLQEGKIPSWEALSAVVHNLVERNDWQRASEVVTDAYHSDGLPRAGNAGGRGKKEFWNLVNDLRRRGLRLGGDPGESER